MSFCLDLSTRGMILSRHSRFILVEIYIHCILGAILCVVSSSTKELDKSVVFEIINKKKQWKKNNKQKLTPKFEKLLFFSGPAK
jgi:hypothetical protein